MVKAEKGTPKDIANRAKSKGLQKLQYYCQPCAKQCRDANGYKCHQTSSAHLRNMTLLLEGDAATAIDDFSKTFEDGFVSNLRSRHGVKRVFANVAYQEVIADKQHVHMNATKWTTLSEFVVHLGKSGRCIVDEDERGFYVQYIERDASKLEKAEKLADRERKEREEEDRMKRRADRCVREASERDDDGPATGPTEMKKREEGVVVSIKLGGVGDAKKRSLALGLAPPPPEAAAPAPPAPAEGGGLVARGEAQPLGRPRSLGGVGAPPPSGLCVVLGPAAAAPLQLGVHHARERVRRPLGRRPPLVPPLLAPLLFFVAVVARIPRTRPPSPRSAPPKVQAP